LALFCDAPHVSSPLPLQINFTLIPSASTVCVGIGQNEDPAIDCGPLPLPSPAHVCVRCGGEFYIGIEGATVGASINIGFAYLQPGSWGRYKDLPVLASAVEALQAMGVTLIRQGGSFSQEIAWKEWRGPLTQRPSMQLVWGYSLIGGWGPFGEHPLHVHQSSLCLYTEHDGSG
jgi:hypothetical protein